MTVAQLHALMSAAARTRREVRWLVVDAATGVVVREERYLRPVAPPGCVVVVPRGAL